MFFYNYHCYMKKHGITDDILSIPSDEEDEVELVEGAEHEDNLGVGDESAIISL